MPTTSERLGRLAIQPADILLPRKGTDLKKWAVVACDQYTSEPEYWKRVEAHVGEEPSTLRLIFPECYLDDGSATRRIANINATMQRYLQQGLFECHRQAFVLVHRSIGEAGRWGLLVALDLEQYDFSKDSRSLIRATEGTILSRIPPRKAIRKDAPLELPHIMVLLSDAERSVIEPLAAEAGKLPCLYDTDLMEGGGHISGYLVDRADQMERIADALSTLADKLDPANPLLYAMGDGNHSLATAKSCWEDVKKTLPENRRKNHPARYALVELENIYDPGLTFEPIHRVLFGVKRSTFLQVLGTQADSISLSPVSSLQGLREAINAPGPQQRFGICDADGMAIVTLGNPSANIAAGTLQSVIDELVTTQQGEVDYIHGMEVVESLGRRSGNIGLILPDVSKETFFDTIIKDSALPRKTFSMGEANEKRYYLEARRIID